MITKDKMILKCFILVMLLLVTMPIKAVAADASSIEVSTTEEFLNALGDETITVVNVMSDDIDLSLPMQVFDISGKTINLNNHVIKTDNMAVVLQGNNFVIKDGTFDAEGQSYSLFIGDVGSTDGVTIENITGLGGFNIFNSTNVVIRNCNVTGSKYYAIWCDQGGQASIESGEYKTDGVAVVGMSSHVYDTKLEIKGGTFLTNGKPLVLEGKDEEGNDWGMPEISGGKFDIKVDEKYCKSGYEPTEMIDGSYTVCNHTTTNIVNKVDATCTEDGYTGDTVCQVCSKIIQKGEAISHEGHSITRNDRIEATCTTDGMEEYYSCSKCNLKFKDENAKEVLDEVEVIPALGHVPSDWKQDEEYHWKECTLEGCGVIIEESKQKHVEKDGICEICSYEISKVKDILDNDTNIKIEYEKSTLPENIDLQVSEVIEGDVYSNIQKVLNTASKIKVFDINLLKDGSKVQPSGKIKLTIPIPEGFDKTRLVIYRVDESKKIEYQGEIVTIDNKEFVQFETDHFSYYVVAEKSTETDIQEEPEQKPEEQPESKPEEEPQGNPEEEAGHKLEDEPKTGEFRTTILASVLLIAMVIGYVICRKKICK